jgi:hypothetical protein
MALSGFLWIWLIFLGIPDHSNIFDTVRKGTFIQEYFVGGGFLDDGGYYGDGTFFVKMKGTPNDLAKYFF